MGQATPHHRQVRRYVATIIGNADAVIDGWRQGQRVDIYRQLRPVVTRPGFGELWPEPRTFRPRRWDLPAPGHRKPAPHEFIRSVVGSTAASELPR
jgi:cytochrome P450